MQCPDGGLRTIDHFDLAQGMLYVIFDRLDADRQRATDFLVAQPEGEMPKHLSFADRQRRIAVERRVS